MSEIVDLKECFKNLKIGSSVKSKKQKVQGQDEERTQALRVLFDILVA